MTTPPRICAGTCGRTLYMRRDKEKNGQAVHQARGLCSACYLATRKNEGYVMPRNNPEPPPEVTTVGTCFDCKRLMVATHIKAAHRPKGMVRHSGKGVCDGCRGRRQREALRTAALAIHGSHDTRWMLDGACAQTGHGDTWFPETGTNAHTAKAICNGDNNRPPCPVRDKCLAYALATEEPHGVWGGLSRKERGELLRRGRQQAAS